MPDVLMTSEQAAWVYEHVILGYHDANEANWWCDPDQDENNLRHCSCTRGQDGCTWCRTGQHERCRIFEAAQAARARQALTAPIDDGQPTAPPRPIGWGPETTVRAPAPWRRNAPKRPLYVPVWLADRVCHYLCFCAVCTPPAVPQVPAAREPLVLADSLQLDLFEAVR